MMQAVVSRYPGREDNRQSLIIGGRGIVDQILPPNYHHNQLQYPKSTLKDSIYKFREFHTVCQARREAAALYETRIETQRTEFLAKKYIETTRQEQRATSCVGLPHSITNNHPAIVASSTSSDTSLPIVTTTVKATTPVMSQGTLYSKLSSFSPDKKYHHFAKQDTTAGPDQATCNVIVKTDPELKEQQRQQVSCSGNKMQGVGGPSLSRSNSGSALKNKSRGRRLSSELTRARSHSQTTPPIDDSGNDLTLTVDDIFSGKIGGTPLLKPIEGPEDPPVTTPTIKSPPVSKRSHVASSPKCTTPTTSTAVRGNIGNMTLRKELDAFSKVLNQVELKEKAKERCSPYGSVPPYPMGPSHLSSPTYMYPMATQQPHPLQPYNNMQSRQFTYENFPSNGGVQESPAYNLINSENRPHPQQHHYLPPTTLSQIGTLLNSPVTTLPSFDYPMPSTMAQTMGYHHNNQMYTNSNLYSNSLSHTPSPSRVRCGWGYSTQDPGGAPYMSNIIGQKRTLQPAGGQYAPPTKVPHSTISHLPLTDNPPPPPCYGSTTHIQYQPPSYNTHIS